MEKEIISLKGRLLLSMPTLNDPRFYHAVIFICAHDETGAMGIIINHPLPGMTMGDLFGELKFNAAQEDIAALPVLSGGPVETSRGFLLHTADFSLPGTIPVNEQFAVSSTTDALEAVAKGKGPKEMLFAVGYSGWGAGQLDEELHENAWIVLDANYELVFNTEIADKWDRAMSRNGIDPTRLSTDAGNA